MAILMSNVTNEKKILSLTDRRRQFSFKSHSKLAVIVMTTQCY
jgi:hypothetical protein